MRYQNFFSQTQRDVPSDAEIVSHQLMLKAGLIKKLAAGLYSWTPMGYRVLKKVEAIVRKHMDASGAQELIMPMVQPAELWQESGRWEQYGTELLRLKDRHQRDFCLGPTHEEVITDMLRTTIKSYRQLPVNLYQIQTKFRDEMRPRFGIMRSREFLMKDAYSFHLGVASLQETYDLMHQTYTNIFNELGLEFRAVRADSGSIGGNFSHEFHVLAESGEDAIAFSDQSKAESQFAANVETVEAHATEVAKNLELKALDKIATPDHKTISSVCQLLKIGADQSVKTLIVNADDELLALVLRGDHQLSIAKAQKNLGVKNALTLADSELIKRRTGCSIGSIGPIGLDIPLVVDRSAAAVSNFVSGANREGYHYQGCNWQRDIGEIRVEDIRQIEDGDPCPDGSGNIVIRRGIEVGHIFQLGNKYSTAMKAEVQDEQGEKQALQMGCYGMGISRIVAAAIEQNHDPKGIIWPAAIAPFKVLIVPINFHKSERVQNYCEDLYQQLLANHIEVLLFDQPDARLGELLNDSELFGIPHRVVIGWRGLQKNSVEYTNRAIGDVIEIDSEHLLAQLLNSCK